MEIGTLHFGLISEDRDRLGAVTLGEPVYTARESHRHHGSGSGSLEYIYYNFMLELLSSCQLVSILFKFRLGLAALAVACFHFGTNVPSTGDRR